MTGLDEVTPGASAAAPPVARRLVPTGGSVVAACAVVSVASLALPATLGFDPWAWLVWGREVGHLGLDTTGGPSWKPLPVLVTTVLTAAGDLAPTLWLVVARTAALLTLVVTYRLAARFAGPAAGAVAAGLLLLTPDGGPRFLRLVAEGHSAPVTATLSLWAVDRHLDGRHGQALLLVTALSLERPEAWPFLALYAAWVWRQGTVRRPLVAMSLAVVPVLWFGADWWGSGDAWQGAGAAQVESGGLADRLALVWGRTARVVVTPAWVAAAGAIVTAWRRRERALLALGAGAVAWLLLVGGMSVGLGYAALSRFLLPAAAVLCVLAGVGLVRIVSAVPRGGARVACVVAIVAVSLPFVAVRVWSFGTEVDGITSRAELEHQLDLVVERSGGPEAVLACGRVVVHQSDWPRVALAWKLDVPLHQVGRHVRDQPAVVFLRSGRAEEDWLTAHPAHEATPLGRSAGWAVYAIGCEPSPPS